MNGVQKRSWWQRNWKWVVPVGCLTPIIICGGGVALFMSLILGTMKSSEAYSQSLAQVKADTAIQAALGTPIEAGFMVSGNVSFDGSSGHADLSYSVIGPNDSGQVFAIADKTAGAWRFTMLDVQIASTGDRIDLLTEP